MPLELVAQEDALGRLERCFTLRHELNALGQRSATTLPHGRRLDLQRYGPGHWIGALWNGRPLVDVERDALHRELVRTWAWQPAPGADGTTPPRLERSWDSLSRPARWRLTGLQGETLSARSWRYDPAGQMLAFEDLRRGEFHYAYDAAGQLRQARQPGLEETFAFDPAGNLMFLPQEASPPALANTAGRDHAHWDQGLAFLEPPAPAVPGPLPPVRHNQLLRYAEGAYRYDARGNVINKLHQAQAGQAPQHLHLHYDLDNRLSRALKPQPGGTLEALYTYDPLGRRVAKQVRSLVPTASASHALQVEQEQLTCFVWDGDLLLQEIADDHTLTHLYEPESFVPYAQVLSPVPATLYDPATVRAEQDRLDRQAAEQQTEAETLAWLALTQPTAHAQLQTTLAERDAQRQAQAHQQQDEQAAADQVCYLLTDPLGTPQEAYSPDGRCLWQARYKAWGRIFKLDHAAIHQPLRFQGQYHDEETGLHYNRHRFYDPDSGRYLTQDPIGLEGGVNVY
ncbi:MAG: RHS domain-containing protein, partial [Azovibrio sp.]|nr:RHS domain-containing protein [Azovibrio sp.]